MNSKNITVGIVVLIAVIIAGIFFFPAYVSMLIGGQKGETTTVPKQSSSAGTDSDGDISNPIQVDSLRPGDIVNSPLTVTGKVSGRWYFEASFPVQLKDGNGTVIASGPAQAQGDWMTSDLVPFSITLTFTAPETSDGVLVFNKDNPSGDPARDESVSIPVSFK